MSLWHKVHIDIPCTGTRPPMVSSRGLMSDADVREWRGLFSHPTTHRDWNIVIDDGRLFQMTLWDEYGFQTWVIVRNG